MVDVLAGELVAGAVERFLHGDPDDVRSLGPAGFVAARVVECLFVPVEQRARHKAGDQTWQTRTACRSRQYQPQTDQVVDRIADHALIHIPDVDGDVARGVRDWA